MAEDMEMFLEQVIKKTNPEEYIKILEQDRIDFAEEIHRLQEVIEEAIEYIENNVDNTGWLEIGKVNVEELLNILKGE